MPTRVVGIGLAGLVALGASTGLVVTWVSGISDAKEPAGLPVSSDADVDPPPPLGFLFLRPDTGRFTVTAFDDRELSDEAKAANPVFNPAWKPFADCLAQRGLAAGVFDPKGRFSQADLDRVLARVNADSPDRTANFALNGADAAGRTALVAANPRTQSAVTFLECAGQWLTKSPEELYKITGEPSEYYPFK